MKERPILFTPTNAQQVWEGTKTQTRRILKTQPMHLIHEHGLVDGSWGYLEQIGEYKEDHIEKWFTCPFGVPGDRLIVGQELPTQRIGVTWLDLLHVRVERLQEITEEDAKAEGCQVPTILWPDSPRDAHSYVEKFKLLWESIHGDKSWELNPWVWVLKFQRSKEVAP